MVERVVVGHGRGPCGGVRGGVLRGRRLCRRWLLRRPTHCRGRDWGAILFRGTSQLLVQRPVALSRWRPLAAVPTGARAYAPVADEPSVAYSPCNADAPDATSAGNGAACYSRVAFSGPTCAPVTPTRAAQASAHATARPTRRSPARPSLNDSVSRRSGSRARRSPGHDRWWFLRVPPGSVELWRLLRCWPARSPSASPCCAGAGSARVPTR